MYKSKLNENIYAKVICDSLHPNQSDRLTTIEVNFPRFILPQLNTHRVFSRNSASSRAVPLEKKIAEVLRNPVYPVRWGENKSGMQSGNELSEEKALIAKQAWIKGLNYAVEVASTFKDLNIHKEIANRVLEPYLWHRVIITSTDYSNMLNQRLHHDTQPEFVELAKCIDEALRYSTPKQLRMYDLDWHLPYLKEEDTHLSIETQRKISVARCARVSYLAHDGTRSIDKDLKLFNKLATASIPHLSPLEHIATPSKETTSNFRNFRQLRHFYENNDLDSLEKLDNYVSSQE